VLDAVQTSTLTTLTLSTNSCEDASKTLKLSRVVRMNFSALKTLNLSFMRLCSAGLDTLLEAISACSLLESLDLSKNHLHHKCLAGVLAATVGCPRLQRFSWAGNRLGAVGTVVLADHIMQNEFLRTTLRELNLGMCDVYTGLHYLVEALEMCTGLRTLDISNNAAHPHEVARLLANTPIASIDISSNYISDYGMRLILERAMHSRSLKDLHILGNHMGRGTIRQLRHLKKVKCMTVRIPRKSCPCNTCLNA
jgi:Ran GTPase-activating protein (RanGAP) involved in mRNA processing and transport